LNDLLFENKDSGKWIRPVYPRKHFY
jgi:hypothetical protein